jgi:hypothetical protein
MILMTCCQTRYATVADTLNHVCSDNIVCPEISTEQAKRFKAIEHAAEQYRAAKDSYNFTDGRAHAGLVQGRKNAVETWGKKFNELFDTLTLEEMRIFGEWRKTQ